MPLSATWMQQEIIILSEVSLKEKELYILLYLESKIWHKWTYLWNRNRNSQKTDLWLPRGRVGGRREGWKFEISRCKLLYTRWINNKVLPYRTGNYTQYSVIHHNRKEYFKKECVCVYIYTYIHIYIHTHTYIYTHTYVCITESLCCIA